MEIQGEEDHHRRGEADPQGCEAPQAGAGAERSGGESGLPSGPGKIRQCNQEERVAQPVGEPEAQTAENESDEGAISPLVLSGRWEDVQHQDGQPRSGGPGEDVGRAQRGRAADRHGVAGEGGGVEEPQPHRQRQAVRQAEPAHGAEEEQSEAGESQGRAERHPGRRQDAVEDRESQRPPSAPDHLVAAQVRGVRQAEEPRGGHVAVQPLADRLELERRVTVQAVRDQSAGREDGEGDREDEQQGAPALQKAARRHRWWAWRDGDRVGEISFAGPVARRSRVMGRDYSFQIRAFRYHRTTFRTSGSGEG